MTSSFRVEQISRAASEVVFAVLADGSRWSDWAGPAVPQSSWADGSPPGGLGSVRRLGVGPLSSREEIVEYDPPLRLGYVLRSGERLHHYRARVELAVEPAGGTRIVWSGSVESRLLAFVFRVLVRGFARRLARYAENVPPGQ